MDQNTAQERPGEMTQEQLELESYTSLIDRYGDSDELRSALAVAWRMGFSRALRLSGSSDPSLTINPFWR